jgi:tetratricopeptide (TPR) repeat protein
MTRPAVLLALLIAGPAEAALPPPDLRDELLRRHWHQIDEAINASCQWASGTPDGNPPVACDPNALAQVIRHARDVQRALHEDAAITVLIGLSYRYSGDLWTAERNFRRATQLDLDRADAWLELGACLQARGAYGEAERAFNEVVRLLPEGSLAWVGWARLAEVAAHQGRADDLERFLMRALAQGFSFRTVAGSALWQGFYRDPTLHDILDELVLVYGEPTSLELLRGAEPTSP